MTSTNGEPQPPDDSGGYCCVMAGMHIGHDEDCVEAHEHEPEASECPVCGGPGFLLGQMGMLTWLRCQNCGIDFHVEAVQ